MTLPPLLALAAGRRVRPRKPSASRPKEIQLHLTVADLLRRFARPNWQWSHFPSGELRDIRTASKLKAMGTKMGWPDIILFDPTGKLHALELKREGETLSDNQEEFQEWCIAHGVPHSVSRSVDEALAVLDVWGGVARQDLRETNMSSAETIKLDAKRRALAPSTPQWLDNMITDDRGAPIPNVANVLEVLRNVAAVENCFRYDEMLCATMLCAPLPYDGAGANEAEDIRPVRDDDITKLQAWLQLGAMPKIARDPVSRQLTWSHGNTATIPSVTTSTAWSGTGRHVSQSCFQHISERTRRPTRKPSAGCSWSRWSHESITLVAASSGASAIHVLQSSALQEKACSWLARCFTLLRIVRTSGARSTPSRFPHSPGA
jgi:VRR-NUC domain